MAVADTAPKQKVKTPKKRTSVKKLASAALLTKKSNFKKSSVRVRKVSSTSGSTRKVSTALRTSAPEAPSTELAQASSQTRALSHFNIERITINTARYAGLSFVVIGAIFTLINAHFVWSQPSFQTANTLTATVSGTQNTATTSIATTTSNIATATNNNYMSLNQTPPLHGIVQVTVHTAGAHQVEIAMFESSWQNKVILGKAQQVNADEWVYAWDTRNLKNNVDYRLTANVWSNAPVTNSNDYSLQLGYMTVSNATTTTSTASSTQNVTTTIDQTPSATIALPSKISGKVTVMVTVAKATNVVLGIEHISSGVRAQLYDAVQIDATHWKVYWPTTQYIDGDYRVVARIKNQYGSYTADQKKTNIVNLQSSLITTQISSTSPTTTLPTRVASSTLAIPRVALTLANQSVVLGTKRIDITTSDTPIASIQLYTRDVAAIVPRLVGAATRVSATQWFINWYTGNTPNGLYSLFARADTPYGALDSKPVSVTVQNQVVPTESKTQAEARTTVTTAVRSLELVATTSKIQLTATTSLGVDTSTQKSFDAQKVLFPYEDEISTELDRLGSATRSSDAPATTRITDRLFEIANGAFQRLPRTDQKPENKEALHSFIQNRIDTYRAYILRIDALIKERQQSSLLKDSDKDGITDFDEIKLYNTDPMVADSDGDGFTDGAEILSGYNPLSDVRESIVAFESPQTTGVYRDDVLAVQTLVATTTPGVDSVATRSILFTGKALPNSFATLYIFSTPIVVTVKTDEDGSWRYRFDHELENGAHTIYVGVTDNAGRIVAKSKPFPFIKNAEAVTPLQAANIDNVVTTSNHESFLSQYMIYLVLSISVLAIGLVLILLGIRLDTRRQFAEELPSQQSL